MGLFLCAPLPNCDQPEVLGGSPGTICLGRHLVPGTMHPGRALMKSVDHAGTPGVDYAGWVILLYVSTVSVDSCAWEQG